jgi:hypothetical protein
MNKPELEIRHVNRSHRPKFRNRTCKGHRSAISNDSAWRDGGRLW